MSKKIYEVNVDIVFSKWIYLLADSEEEAEAKVKEMRFTASDLRDACWVQTEPYMTTECNDGKDPEYYGIEADE